MEYPPTMNNWQAIAYATLAMRECGLSEEEIKRITDVMWSLFDELTPEEARKQAQK